MRCLNFGNRNQNAVETCMLLDGFGYIGSRWAKRLAATKSLRIVAADLKAGHGTAAAGDRVRGFRHQEAMGGAIAVPEAGVDLQLRAGSSGTWASATCLLRDQPSGSTSRGGPRRVRRMFPDALHQQYRKLRSHLGEQTYSPNYCLGHQQAEGEMDVADLASGGLWPASGVVPPGGASTAWAI
jgi:hypothetical protein